MTSTDFPNPGATRTQNSATLRKIAFRFLTASCATLLLASTAGCATSSKKKAPPPPNPVASKLPKPAPMRVSADTSSRRNAPTLPKIVDTTPSSDASATASTDLITPPEKTTVASTVPKFIENEQPQDFFQGAGDAPVGETVLGSFFDSVFRPANPPNQPVSSTSYTVE